MTQLTVTTLDNGQRQWHLAGLFRTITSQRQILLALQDIFRPQSYEENKNQLTLLENHMGSWIFSSAVKQTLFLFLFFCSSQKLQVTFSLRLTSGGWIVYKFWIFFQISKTGRWITGKTVKLSDYKFRASQVHFNITNRNNKSGRWKMFQKVTPLCLSFCTELCML